MRAASGFEPQTKRLETRALVGSATREAYKGNFIEIEKTIGLDFRNLAYQAKNLA